MLRKHATFKRFESACRRDRGMSLVEVSIAMLILGILLSGILATYRVYQKTKAERVTAEHLLLIEEAIGTYFSVEGKYPMPMGFRISEGEEGFGRSGTFSGSCSSLPSDNRVCRMPGSGGDVYIGNLPFQDLNIPMEAALDGYGRRFTYAVSGPLTTSGGTTPTVCVDLYTIQKNGNFATVNCGSNDPYVTGNPPNAPEDIIVVSHGPDGVGAWTAEGRQYLDCDTVAGEQRKNCDLDGTFTRARAIVEREAEGETFDVVRTTRVLAAGARFIDDTVSVDIREDSNFWLLAANHIRSRDALTVGIGLHDPKRDLEVDGSFKADKVHADKLCSYGKVTGESGNECMGPEQIAGVTGMGCDVAGYMAGIAENKAVCQQLVPEFTCGSGHVIVGVDADGKPVCANPDNPTECVTTNQNKAIPCPSGQVGETVMQRQRACPANTWSAWAVLSTTCTPYVQPCATKPPVGVYGVCTQKRDPAGALTQDWHCCRENAACRTVTCQPTY